MVRSNKSLIGRSPKNKPKNTSQSSNEIVITNNSGGNNNSSSDKCANFHEKNLFIFSSPVIFLFNILRSLIYQLFVIFRYIYNATHRVLHRPVKNQCLETLVINKDKDPATLTEISSSEQFHQQQQELALLENSSSLNDPSQPHIYPQEMTSKVGSGDPLLAKQKHHHRKAFEYISKALKIDEENEGEFIQF